MQETSRFQIYVAGTNGDAALLQWYSRLCTDGSLAKAFGRSLWPLGAFMANMVDKNTGLMFAQDELGWWAVTWISPVMGGATWGLWIREDKRAAFTVEKIDFVMQTLDVAFRVYPLILVPTKQVTVKDSAIRLGFAYLGIVPYLFEGEEAHILYQTREMFAPVYETWSKRNGRPR